MEFVNTILLALLPVFVVIIAYWKDKYNRNPFLWVLATFAWGYAIGEVVHYAQLGLAHWQPQGFWGLLYGAFLMEGVCVEILRFIALALLVKVNRRYFDLHHDGIFYAAILSMGMAMVSPTILNVLYHLVLAAVLGAGFADIYFGPKKESTGGYYVMMVFHLILIHFVLYLSVDLCWVPSPYLPSDPAWPLGRMLLTLAVNLCALGLLFKYAPLLKKLFVYEFNPIESSLVAPPFSPFTADEPEELEWRNEIKVMTRSTRKNKKTNTTPMQPSELLAANKIERAFKAMYPVVAEDKQVQPYFLELLANPWNLFRLHDYAYVMEGMASQGNPWMQLAWARYSDMVNPFRSSLADKMKYYTRAMNAGIADARMYLAFCWRDGDFGVVNRDHYLRGRNRALKEGSLRAKLVAWGGLIFGWDDVTPNLQQAYDAIMDVLKNTSESEFVSARLYRFAGFAAEDLGKTEEAEQLYQKAADMGDNWCWCFMANLYYDFEKSEYRDYEKFASYMNEGKKHGAANCFLLSALTLEHEEFCQPDTPLYQQCQASFLKDTEMAYRLGEMNAARTLGRAYHDGLYGLTPDMEKAWEWYSKGALFRDTTCMEQLAAMIEEKNAPAEHQSTGLRDLLRDRVAVLKGE